MYRTEINLEKFEFGQKPNGAGANANYNAAQPAASSPAASKPTEAPKAGEINYPEEEINPEDIPF